MAMLEVDELTVVAGGRPLADRVSFSFGSDELVAMIGPNGAGKSTILRAIVGTQSRHHGRVILAGKAIEQWSHVARARQLAYLPQERHVSWNLTVQDLVQLGRFPHEQSRRHTSDNGLSVVADALAKVGAGHLAERRFGVLSGGEKALVLLARMLAVQAPLMLVDEPIAGLDPYHQLQVMAVLREVAMTGHGILMVLHDLTLAARFASRVILVHKGRVRADGPPAQVLTDAALADTFGVSVRRSGQGADVTLVPWDRLPT